MAADNDTLPSSRAKAKAAGATHYFTGKPCPHGHVTPRFTSSGGCVVCTEERKRARRRLFKEQKGLTYFTGKPCLKGHVAERYTSSDTCVVCAYEQSKERRQRPDVKEHDRQYWQRPEVKARHRARQQSPEGKKYRSDYYARPDVQERVEDYRRDDRNIQRKKAWSKNYAQQPGVKPRKALATRTRTARKLRQTPPWFEQERERIEALYVQASQLSESTGIPHDVDHIVPLQHPRVSGLHCLANLQILPRRENQSKNNRFDVG